MTLLPATDDPLIVDAHLQIQRQDATDNSWTTIYAGLPANITYDKGTQITPFGERQRIRFLIRAGCAILLNDQVLVSDRTDGRGGFVAPANPEVYQVADFNDMGKLRPLGQILVYKTIQ